MNNPDLLHFHIIDNADLSNCHLDIMSNEEFLNDSCEPGVIASIIHAAPRFLNVRLRTITVDPLNEL